MKARGFTLIELLTAIAIFAVLAGMLFQMVKGALDVWRIGEGNRQTLEKGVALLDEITSDLRMARADNPAESPDVPVRMLADWGLFDLDVDATPESLLQRFRWVRSLPEERFDPRIRQGGDTVDGEGEVSDVGSARSHARAPGGMAEIAYATCRIPAKGADPALLTLYRMFRAPIGGAGTLLGEQPFDDPRRLHAAAVPLAEDVLHLQFEFWSRDTTSFDGAPDAPGGPLTTWDSTRAVLQDPAGSNRFLLAKDPASLTVTHDDVFPRRVRVTLVLARDSDAAAQVRLTADLSAASTQVTVGSARPFGAKAVFPFLKIGGEWMRWTKVDGTRLTVVRAQRGTGKLAHAAGAVVHVGETFQEVIDVPVYREDWNEP